MAGNDATPPEDESRPGDEMQCPVCDFVGLVDFGEDEYLCPECSWSSPPEHDYPELL